MHPYILKKAESQKEPIQDGALLLADIVIDPSTWSCEEYIKLLTVYGRGIWHFLHWMTRKGFLPSIPPLRKGRKGIRNRVMYMARSNPELAAYAGDPNVDVRTSVSFSIPPDHPIMEFLARDSAERVRQYVAERVPVESQAFRILQQDFSADVRWVTGGRLPPVLGDTLTYDYLFRVGLPMYILKWFRKEYPAGVPLTRLDWESGFCELFDDTSPCAEKDMFDDWLIVSNIRSGSQIKAQHSQWQDQELWSR